MCPGSVYWGHLAPKNIETSTNGSIRSESRRGRHQLLPCFPILKHSTRGIGGRSLHCEISIRPMSALGEKQHAVRYAMSALPPKADIANLGSTCPLCANRDLAHCSKKHHYSITSSASASTVGG